jgi:hypothetical protein
MYVLYETRNYGQRINSYTMNHVFYRLVVATKLELTQPLLLHQICM